MSSMRRDRPEVQHSLMLLLILGLAGVLRVSSLSWGLPNALHPTYSYHPDEAYFLNWAHAMASGYWFPKLFQYGGTGFYALLAWVDALGRWYTESFGGLLARNTILLGRLANIAVSLLTILATYRLALMVSRRKVALIAALLLAVMPAHVFWAVRVRPDELFTLLVVLNLLMAASMLAGKTGTARVLISGLLLGMTIAVRFPGAVLAVSYAFALYHGRCPHLGKALAAGAAATLVGYGALSPGTLIHPDLWLAGMQVQWSYQTSQPVGALPGLPVGLQYGTWILSEAMGLPLYVTAVAAIALALRKGLPAVGLFACFLIPYGLMLASASWVVARYTMPLLPLLCIWAAAGLAAAWQARRAASASILGLAVAATLLLDAGYAHAIRAPDPRDVAGLWLARHAPKQARMAGFIGYRGDLFSTPPPSRNQRWTYFIMQGDGIDRFLAMDFDYIIIHAQWMDTSGGTAAQQALVRWLARQQRYRPVAIFERPPQVLGIPLGWAFASNDYRLALPVIHVLQRSQARP